ncbi:unnamed protein product, partial [Oikopleura dioica]
AIRPGREFRFLYDSTGGKDIF